MVDIFVEGVMDDFCRSMRAKGESPTPVNMLHYLVNHNYIPSHNVRHKAILTSFVEHNDPELKRKDVVLKVAVSVGCSDRTVANTLKWNGSKFRGE